MRALLTALLLAAVAFGGCGGGSARTAGSAAAERSALVAYLRQVEPIRLAVNRLLEDADPILSSYRSGRLSPAQASRQMSALEGRFASYTVDIAAIEPVSATLRSLHLPYAHTYVLEDAYLSALASVLATRDVQGLPNTQASQRAAIIQWRTGLEVLARHAALALPGDLQAAGRGEIAPSPAES